jgi:hypothetical protein
MKGKALDRRGKRKKETSETKKEHERALFI